MVQTVQESPLALSRSWEKGECEVGRSPDRIEELASCRTEPPPSRAPTPVKREVASFEQPTGHRPQLVVSMVHPRCEIPKQEPVGIAEEANGVHSLMCREIHEAVQHPIHESLVALEPSWHPLEVNRTSRSPKLSHGSLHGTRHGDVGSTSEEGVDPRHVHNKNGAAEVLESFGIDGFAKLPLERFHVARDQCRVQRTEVEPEHRSHLVVRVQIREVLGLGIRKREEKQFLRPEMAHSNL